MRAVLEGPELWLVLALSNVGVFVICRWLILALLSAVDEKPPSSPATRR